LQEDSLAMLEGFEVSLAGIVSSLILVPIRSGLRGFCLFIFMKNVFDYLQNKPLKHNACLLSIDTEKSLMLLNSILLIAGFGIDL
jgi:hypothetical protein